MWIQEFFWGKRERKKLNNWTFVFMFRIHQLQFTFSLSLSLSLSLTSNHHVRHLREWKRIVSKTMKSKNFNDARSKVKDTEGEREWKREGRENVIERWSEVQKLPTAFRKQPPLSLSLSTIKNKPQDFRSLSMAGITFQTRLRFTIQVIREDKKSKK